MNPENSTIKGGEIGRGMDGSVGGILEHTLQFAVANRYGNLTAKRVSDEKSQSLANSEENSSQEEPTRLCIWKLV